MRQIIDWFWVAGLTVFYFLFVIFKGIYEALRSLVKNED